MYQSIFSATTKPFKEDKRYILFELGLYYFKLIMWINFNDLFNLLLKYFEEIDQRISDEKICKTL